MKTKFIPLVLIFFLVSLSADGQILKKLKKKVEQTSEKVLLKKTEQQTEKTVSGAIDGVANPGMNPSEDDRQASEISQKKDPNANKAKLINNDAKRAFYTTDVIVRTSDSKKGKGSEYYFDSEEIAARGIAPESDNPIYIDSEGFQYGYNESERRWEKTGLMRSDAMSFMMPMVSIGMLKLPSGPTLQASEKLKEQGLNMNTFQIVEWAFIYKPEHFRNEDYQETTAECPGGGTCSKFTYNDPEYKGSWVLFDSKDRLAEIYAKVNNDQMQGDGSYKFEYSPVTVNVPSAVEVKMPFQDLFMQGLDTPDNNNREAGTSGNEDYDSGISHSQINAMQENMKNSDVNSEDLPATYDFDWKYHLKMDFVNQKKESMDLVFLLKENVNYQGVSIENVQQGSINEATMIFDLNINSLVMFIEADQNKILQIHPMQSGKSSGEMDKMQIRELPPKNIIGYNCKGLEVENDKYIVQVYTTSEAPIEMKNLFNFSGPMKMDVPDIDPMLVKQFSKGLIMEMNYKDKKKLKNEVMLTAQSLKQARTTFNKNDYQNMSFMGQLKSGNN